jgi:hypothetical protein
MPISVGLSDTDQLILQRLFLKRAINGDNRSGIEKISQRSDLAGGRAIYLQFLLINRSFYVKKKDIYYHVTDNRNFFWKLPD